MPIGTFRSASRISSPTITAESAASATAGTFSSFSRSPPATSGAILAAAGLYVWIGLTSAAAAALLAYLNSLQVDNTIVTYNQSATKLAGIERDWRALGTAQLDPGAFEKLMSRSETVLTGELTGWVQQMSDTMHELKNKQASMANQIEPGRASEPPEHQATA